MSEASSSRSFLSEFAQSTYNFVQGGIAGGIGAFVSDASSYGMICLVDHDPPYIAGCLPHRPGQNATAEPAIHGRRRGAVQERGGLREKGLRQ